MARHLRIEMENGLYHMTARGWERRVSGIVKIVCGSLIEWPHDQIGAFSPGC